MARRMHPPTVLLPHRTQYTGQYNIIVLSPRCPAADSHHTRHKAAAMDGLRVEEAAATPLQAPHNEAAGATRGKGRRGRGLLDFVVGHG